MFGGVQMLRQKRFLWNEKLKNKQNAFKNSEIKGRMTHLWTFPNQKYLIRIW